MPFDTRLEHCTIDGPELRLAPKMAVTFALGLHELCTNAFKYGSLSVPEGQVDVRWQVETARLKLTWQERGGPAVKAPSARGFGTRMIERGLAAELGGEVRIEFHPAGVTCTIDAPLP
jgi:two-component sensor histidine kinase